jgi:hypothetical protein
VSHWSVFSDLDPTGPDILFCELEDASADEVSYQSEMECR